MEYFPNMLNWSKIQKYKKITVPKYCGEQFQQLIEIHRVMKWTDWSDSLVSTCPLHDHQ